MTVVVSGTLSKLQHIAGDNVTQPEFNGRAFVFRSETLPVEYLGGKPLCMNQYYEVLSSCRIPGLKRDSVVNHAKSSRPPKHVTVVHNLQVRTADQSPHLCHEARSAQSVTVRVTFTGPDVSADEGSYNTYSHLNREVRGQFCCFV